jgi:hypothetical protein
MKKVLFVFASALILAGCFGGETDAPTAIVKEDPKVADSLPKVKSITPGLYVGYYDWIDTARQGLESEFVLAADGKYRFFYIMDSNAFYDQNGKWYQQDSALFFSGTKDCRAYNDGVFYEMAEVENDTNTIHNITDSSFQRKEYTPFRQKPYWITYSRKTAKAVKEGSYSMQRPTTLMDSIPDTLKFVIALSKDDLTFSVTQAKVVAYQASAKYYQVGSFLIAEQNRYREIDSTNSFGAWNDLEGYSVQRVRKVSDTSFDLMSSVFGYEAGSWDPYKRQISD